MAIADGRVVSNFIVQAVTNQPITIYGDGSQTRSFCYVKDLVEAIVRITELSKPPKTPINLGNPNEFTMLELAEKIIELSGSTSTLVFSELPEDDPRQRKPDISKAKQLIDWEPAFQLEEGLRLTIEYFKNEITGE
jgi:UDP-glucuronate decarboxylase